MASGKKLRLTTRYQEIFNVISKAIGSEESFIWKSEDKKRTTYPVLVVSMSSDDNQVTLKQKESVKNFKVGEQIYLKLEHRDSAFKAEVVEQLGARIIITFPDELALIESRANPRFYFHPTEDKWVQIRTSVYREQGLPERLHNLSVCDVSLGGIAVFIPMASKKYFEVKSKIQVVTLGLHRFEKPIKGEILFRIPYEMKSEMVNRSGFKIGIKFEQNLTKVALDRFLVKRNIFSITNEQLVRDEEFRKTVNENMAQIRKNLSTRKTFKELFSTIDGTTASNHYFKQHIHLLCQVLAGLGTRLGWISDRSIDKLIYVAYLHDIRFASFPHLARIPSKAKFEKLKHTLTDEEVKAFLEAPAYAAELARMDLESYPDAIKILTQQKELPDGTGFPHGLTASLIAPLSCLFIVAHYFVDYVIDHPDWTVNDFVKTYRTRLKGQYFQKVFEAMKE